MKTTKRSYLLMTAALVVPVLLQACGPSKNRGSYVGGDIPSYPQSGGPLRGGQVFKTPELRPPVSTPVAPSGETSIPEELVEPRTAERKLLCEDAHTTEAAARTDVKCPTCDAFERTTDRPKNTKLDILFVADTSPSLETERSKISKGIRKFIDQLPSDTDYHIAVMPAHSDVSYDPAVKKSTGLAGKLIVAGKEPAVLKRSQYKDFKRMNELLTQKLVKIRADGASDGGELGLFSLTKGITEPQLTENRLAGFFREEAALAVIFISDENDICSYGNYPDGILPAPNVNFYNDKELGKITVEEKAAKFYCQGGNGQPIVNDKTVMQKLQEVKQVVGKPDTAKPILLAGIIYTNDRPDLKQPKADEKHAEYVTENEVGYGYLELIRNNGGVAVDIEDDYTVGLTNIGKAARDKLTYAPDFQIPGEKVIDPATLCVMMDGKELPQGAETVSGEVKETNFWYQPELRTVHVRGIGPKGDQGGTSKVEIFVCEPLSELRYDREIYSTSDVPTPSEHYRNLPVPSACQRLKKKIATF